MSKLDTETLVEQPSRSEDSSGQSNDFSAMEEDSQSTCYVSGANNNNVNNNNKKKKKKKTAREGRKEGEIVGSGNGVHNEQ